VKASQDNDSAYEAPSTRKGSHNEDANSASLLTTSNVGDSVTMNKQLGTVPPENQDTVELTIQETLNFTQSLNEKVYDEVLTKL
jgi:hypothetical protein